MREPLRHLLAGLAVIALLVAPTALADAPATDATPAVATQAAADGALFLQGPPSDLPNQGYACELPPQQQNEDCVCPLVFDPVCGCNGETYSNACFAACEVRTWSEGACDDFGSS